ncbi:MAG: hypothetical protein WDW36_009135 [Sanguina aurantia]
MDLPALSTYIRKYQGTFLEGNIFGLVKPSATRKGRGGRAVLAITPPGPIVVPEGVTVRLHAGQAVYHGADEGSSTLIGLNVGDGAGGVREARLLFKYRNTSMKIVGPATAREVLVLFSRHVALEGARNSVLADRLASTCEGGEDEWEEERGSDEEGEGQAEGEEGSETEAAAAAGSKAATDAQVDSEAAAAAAPVPAATGRSSASDWKKKLGVISESEVARFVLPAGQDVMSGDEPCPVLEIYPDPTEELDEGELLQQCRGYESRCKFGGFEVYDEREHRAMVATVSSDSSPDMPQYMPSWSEPEN